MTTACNRQFLNKKITNIKEAIIQIIEKKTKKSKKLYKKHNTSK